jgi:hypothetical protein
VIRHVTISTDTSRPISPARGILSAAAVLKIRAPQKASRRLASGGQSEQETLREELAEDASTARPNAARTATSLAVDRACEKTFATFAHAMRRTNPTAQEKIQSVGRTLPVTCSISGTMR